MLTILLVDDNKNEHTLMQEIFKNSPFNLFCALGAVDAGLILEAQDISLVILDVYLKDQNGLCFAYYLKNTHQTKHIPILFLSNTLNAKDLEEAIDIGAVDFVRKTEYYANPNILIEKVNIILNVKETL